MTTPIYATYGRTESRSAPGKSRPYSIQVARTLNDMMKVVAIRSAVFLSEQTCPYPEEFDGNDFCATHLIGYVDNEPAACLRVRFFASFAKIERLAVRHEHRNSRLSFDIVWAGIELCRKKGYTTIYGHAQDRLVKFWSRFGAKPMGGNRKLVFSDYSYTEMLLEVEPHPDPLTLDSDPYELIRPEGEWDEPGVLENSMARPVTSPLGDRKAA
ncbi:GNAT family N-acetyltransferase [Microbaculum marinum]|uniref:GNAT family N-acetyltransferase n=1 Tax=Microbaculum marinum TaxID=1764581 RepID=A0AAW9RKY5_9HYPH